MFLLGSFVPTFLVDRLGRRNPMMWGSFGLGLSMMLISILLSFRGTSVEKATATASVTFFFTVSASSLISTLKLQRPSNIFDTVHAYLRRLCELHSLGLRP